MAIKNTTQHTLLNNDLYLYTYLQFEYGKEINKTYVEQVKKHFAN